MNSTDNPLEQLRDIHLPTPIPVWPPAPGWWMLFLLVIVVVVFGVWVYRRFIRPTVRKQALIELELLNQRLEIELNEAKGTKQYFIDISILLRRIAISVFGSKQVAGLAGERWLKFLDETSNTTYFTAGNGRLLISVPYSNDEEVNIVSAVGVVSEVDNEQSDLDVFNAEIKNWVLKNT